MLEIKKQLWDIFSKSTFIKYKIPNELQRIKFSINLLNQPIYEQKLFCDLILKADEEIEIENRKIQSAIKAARQKGEQILEDSKQILFSFEKSQKNKDSDKLLQELKKI